MWPVMTCQSPNHFPPLLTKLWFIQSSHLESIWKPFFSPTKPSMTKPLHTSQTFSNVTLPALFFEHIQFHCYVNDTQLYLLSNNPGGRLMLWGENWNSFFFFCITQSLFYNISITWPIINTQVTISLVKNETRKTWKETEGHFGLVFFSKPELVAVLILCSYDEIILFVSPGYAHRNRRIWWNLSFGQDGIYWCYTW